MKSTDVLQFKVHKEGNIFIAGGAAVSLLLFFVFPPLGWVGLLLTLFVMFFFRDPERVTPAEKGQMISPADGVVSAITKMGPPPEFEDASGEYTRISIFLSVFNVHVNRSPVSGEVSALRYIPGEFKDAATETAGEQNERQLVEVVAEDGNKVYFAQVAGLIARRIICDLEPGKSLSQGDRFGLIRFGSRTDLYVPEGYEVTVSVGQTMFGGETVMARAKS